MRRKFMTSQQSYEDMNSYWIIFDENDSSTILMGGGNDAVRQRIRSKFKRCMAMPRYHEQGNSKAVIAYLDENDSTKWPDGSTVSEININGYGEYIMVHFPKYYYRNEDLGNNRYKLYVSDIKVNDGYKEERECLIGVFEATYLSTSIKYLVSWNDVVSISNLDITTLYSYARNNGSNWGLVDYRAHKTIANMFCIMYGNTNISTLNPDIPCSGGTKVYNVGKTGGTMTLGNKDGRAEVNDDPAHYSTSFLGLEDCYYSKWEFIQGINIVADRQWVVYDGGLSVDKTAEELIAEGFTNVRTIGTASSVDGWITKIKHGEYADVMPVATGVGSDTTYYADYYYRNAGNRTLLRSGSSEYDSICGVFAAFVNNASSYSGSSIGSRLGFYGTIEVVTPEEWLKLSPQYGDNSGSGGIN